MRKQEYKDKYIIEKNGKFWSIKNKRSGFYIDHDLVLRDNRPEYAGIWILKKEIKDFLIKHKLNV